MPRMETRMMQCLQMRANDTADEGKQIVEGYAALFNEETVLYKSKVTGWEYREIIEYGAFDKCDMSDVMLNYNHGMQAMVLARTKNNTLQLGVDEKGLKITGDIISNTAGTDIYKSVQRGDLNQMSFAFTVGVDTEQYDHDNKIYTRRITSIDKLHDVSIVDVPAYDGTTVSARDGKQMIERIERIEKINSLRARLI